MYVQNEQLLGGVQLENISSEQDCKGMVLWC